MPWGAKEEKKEEVEPTTTERDVLVYEINECQNDTLESTRLAKYDDDMFPVKNKSRCYSFHLENWWVVLKASLVFIFGPNLHSRMFAST